MRGQGIVLAGIVALSCTGGAAPTAAPATAAAPSPTAVVPTPSAKALWRPASPPQGAPKGSQWVTIDGSDGTPLTAAVFPSPRAGAAPVAVYLYFNDDVQLNEGLLPRDLDFAAALANEGFLTVAPCWQQPSTVNTADPCGQSAPRPQASIAKDIAAVADAARTLPGARADRLVVVGRSTGGTAALLAASMGGLFDAVVAISAAYGVTRSRVSGRFGTTAPEHVDGLAAPLLIVHGTADAWAPGTRVEAVRSYEKSARDKGKKVESLYVDGADDMLLFSPTYWTRDVFGKVIAFLRG